MFTPDKLPTLHRMQAARDRINRMIHERACREYGLAFGNANCKSLDMCVIHNSIGSRESGRPWPEVDYHHMRRAAWLTSRFEAGRLVDQWYQRQCRAA